MEKLIADIKKILSEGGFSIPVNEVSELIEEYEDEEKKKKEISAGYLTCEECGAKDDTVNETICPFQEGMFNREIDVTLCNECYRDRVQNI